MRDIFVSLRRTPYQSLASFLVLFFTLFLSTGLFIGLIFLHGLLNYVETLPQVTIYFQRNSTEADVFKVRDSLMSSGKVASINYVSKKEAFEIFKELNKDKPLLLEMVSANVLPPSLEIHPKKSEHLLQIADFSKKQAGVEEVRFAQDTSERLVKLTDILRKTSFVLFVYLIVMSIIVLATITLFKIAMKKEEIEVYQLLGASKWYIKKPYLLETIVVGMFASVCSFVVTIIGLFYLKPFLSVYLARIPALTLHYNAITLTAWPINNNFLLITFLLSLVFGTSIALVASLMATEKYLS